MKKTILTVSSLVLFASLASAQVYFRAGAGYALPIASESIGEKQLELYVSDGNTNTLTNTRENVSASFASGVNFSAGGGFMFSEFFGVDLNVSYLSGKKYEASDIYKQVYDDGSSNTDQTIITTNSNAIFVTPSFVITTGGSNAPYGRFGVIIGSPTIKGEEDYYYDFDGVETELRKWEVGGGISTGFQGAVGMNWGLGDNLKLYTEINFTSMTYYPKEYTLTEASEDGVSYLDQLTVSEKKTEFVKKIDNTLPDDNTKPRQELRQGTPFSSIALQVGIVYSIGGKSM